MKVNNQVEYIYEDEHLIVISKPAGILTIPDRYDKNAPNLRAKLTRKYGKIFVVHRLDKGTSGVMVFLKTAEAHKALNQQFQDNEVEKLYHVVVSGIVIQDKINIDIPLIPDQAKLGQTKPAAKGKESLTILKVLERYRIASLVECNLVTGRHHQIRVHCSAIGHPLLIDELYGNNNEFFLSSIKRKYKLKKDSIENPIISRVTMHSREISFDHPVSGEKMTFLAEYPRDFQALLQVLRKYCSLGKYQNLNEQLTENE